MQSSWSAHCVARSLGASRPWIKGFNSALGVHRRPYTYLQTPVRRGFLGQQAQGDGRGWNVRGKCRKLDFTSDRRIALLKHPRYSRRLAPDHASDRHAFNSIGHCWRKQAPRSQLATFFWLVSYVYPEARSLFLGVANGSERSFSH
jgi:hypothetical protein